MITPGQFVLAAHTALFDSHDTAVLDTAFAPNFIEHSPLIANDKVGLAEFVASLGEELRYHNVRVIDDRANKFVALHGRFDGIGETPLVGFDIYRLEDGLIVEHWDNLVPLVTEPNPAGHTQLDGPTEPDHRGLTDTNRALVTEFFTRAFINGDYDCFNFYTRDGQLTQHAPEIGDGPQAIVDYLTSLRDAGEALVYDRLHRTVGDSQFILTHSEGSIQGVRHAFCELWRVDGLKIAEMWNAAGAVPADNEAKHSHGIF